MNDELYQKLVNIDGVKMSIIISTYKNVEFIDECVNSIINCYESHKCEILIGIDNCEQTLEHIQNNSYPQNVKFYYFEENYGPYIVFNTLSQISNSDVIMFFGSDDVMGKNMINQMTINNNVDFIKPKFVNFNDGVDYNTIDNSKLQYGEGVFSIRKNIFTHLNGFEPWRCAADSDFMGRLYQNKYKLKVTNDVVFYRRIHKNSLTQSSQTSYFSELRKEYATVSKNKKYFGPLPELIVKSYIEVFPNEILPIVINKTPLSEKLFVESSGEKYDKIDNIFNDRNNDYIGENVYIKTSGPDKPVSLNITSRRIENTTPIEPIKGTIRHINNKLFGKPRKNRFNP